MATEEAQIKNGREIAERFVKEEMQRAGDLWLEWNQHSADPQELKVVVNGNRLILSFPREYLADAPGHRTDRETLRKHVAAELRRHNAKRRIGFV